MNTETLKKKWDALLEEQPKLRIRNAAKELGVSEAELLNTQIGENVIRLRPEFKEILGEIESLGKVMALTRNDDCVHERNGVYKNADFSSPFAGLFVGDDIDLRIFLMRWRTAFAVDDNGRKSIQFFGKDGTAVHKIFLLPESNETRYEEIIAKYKANDQHESLNIEAMPAPAKEKPDSEVNINEFQEAWKGLKDTHDFYEMLKKYGVSRTQALRLAPSKEHAHKIKADAISEMLEKAAEQEIPIMVFVGNYGNIQIHTGEIKNTMWREPWFNILDPDFSLHLKIPAITETWIVRKPTEDGIVTSIETYDKDGEMIAQFFGKRKPGNPELKSWQSLVEDIEKKYTL